MGLIPAHAGKTMPPLIDIAHREAHPRSRGENEAQALPDGSLYGSSPLTRGKPITGAGIGSLSGGSSPLTRGKPLIIDGMFTKNGLIPAHAGKT